MKTPLYTVLTSRSILDSVSIIELNNEQSAILASLEIDEFRKTYKVHFFDTPFTDEFIDGYSVFSAIEMLAIKDGFDLVRFDNGNIGFVSYCNGSKDAFEILGEWSDDDESEYF